jgi:CRISPR-associated exonuclease Cas4
MQLAAYCLLIEENKKSFVPYGVIIYKNSDHKITFNPKLRFELESTIKQMREFLNNNSIQLNHNDPQKCRSCSMKRYCLDRLA